MTLSKAWQYTTDQSVVLDLQGELDYATAPDLRAAISEAATRHPRPSMIVVDLSQVGFIDDIGVRTLIVGNRVRNQVGIDLAVRYPSPLVRRLLGMARNERLDRRNSPVGRVPETQVRVRSLGTG